MTTCHCCSVCRPVVSSAWRCCCCLLPSALAVYAFASWLVGHLFVALLDWCLFAQLCAFVCPRVRFSLLPSPLLLPLWPIRHLALQRHFLHSQVVHCLVLCCNHQSLDCYPSQWRLLVSSACTKSVSVSLFVALVRIISPSLASLECPCLLFYRSLFMFFYMYMACSCPLSFRLVLLPLIISCNAGLC
jgi:hypothetical protein